MILKPVSFVLNGVLEKNDTYLPLSQVDMNRLLAHVPDGEETILTIQDNLYTEWVHVYNDCGTVLLERGLGGSEPRKFPRGTCVFFEMSLPLVQWLICNYDCCEDDDCDCEAVTLESHTLPAGIVNQLWDGRMAFVGTLPINIKITPPSWATAEVLNGEVFLTGTPDKAGIYQVGYSATNCRGSVLVSDTLSFQVFNVSTEGA